MCIELFIISFSLSIVHFHTRADHETRLLPCMSVNTRTVKFSFLSLGILNLEITNNVEGKCDPFVLSSLSLSFFFFFFF